MADQVKYKDGTESQILALTTADSSWSNKAFYYPSDKSYFYRALDGVMVKYGDGASSSVGCKINGAVVGGVKNYILTNETLEVPENYEYNVSKMKIDGDILQAGTVNIG